MKKRLAMAFGGGSVLDAAKAVALLVTNPEQTLSAMTESSVLRPRLPLIAVPTTAGTGSETTNVTVIIDAVITKATSSPPRVSPGFRRPNAPGS